MASNMDIIKSAKRESEHDGMHRPGGHWRTVVACAGRGICSSILPQSLVVFAFASQARSIYTLSMGYD